MYKDNKIEHGYVDNLRHEFIKFGQDDVKKAELNLSFLSALSVSLNTKTNMLSKSNVFIPVR